MVGLVDDIAVMHAIRLSTTSCSSYPLHHPPEAAPDKSSTYPTVESLTHPLTNRKWSEPAPIQRPLFECPRFLHTILRLVIALLTRIRKSNFKKDNRQMKLEGALMIAVV